jgi:hypothetical protein
VSSVPWPDESRAHRLKVTLEGIRPPAWRRLEVDGATTLEDLHEVLQIAFGWTDWHLHQFVVDGIAYGAPDPEFGSRLRGEGRMRLHDVLRRPRERMVSEYDFGDLWHHVIVLEAIAAGPAGTWLQRCIGRR